MPHTKCSKRVVIPGEEGANVSGSGTQSDRPVAGPIVSDSPLASGPRVVPRARLAWLHLTYSHTMDVQKYFVGVCARERKRVCGMGVR